VLESDSSSMVVEIDSPGNIAPEFTVFEDPVQSPRYRMQRVRERKMVEGGIASRQKLRRKIRRKAPGEISANIMRSTGSVLGKTVSGTVEKAKDAFGIVRESTGHLGKLGKIVRKWKQKMENPETTETGYTMDRRTTRRYMRDTLRGYNREGDDVLTEYPRTAGDELHKYLYDLHGAGIESQSSTTDENRPPSVGYVVPVDDGWNRRRQTWTNLTGVLMDKESILNGEESLAGQCGSEERGLPVIEEVVEISQCGITPRKRDFSRTSVRDIAWEDVEENKGQKGKGRVGKGTLKKVEEYLHGMTISPPTETPIDPIAASDPPTTLSPSSPTKPHPLPSQHKPTPPASFPASLPSHPTSTTFIPTTPFPNEQNWESFSTTSLAPSPSHKAHLPISETTQDLFNINSTTYYTVPMSNDLEPVKTTPLPPMEAEITRSESILNHYITANTGTITFPNQPTGPPCVQKKENIGTKKEKKIMEEDVQQSLSDKTFRLVSGESHKISSSSYSDILGGQDFPRQPRHLSSSTSSLSVDQDPFQRQVSSIYSRPQNSRQVSQTMPPFHGRSTSDTTGLLGADTSRLLSRVDDDECVLIPEKRVEFGGEKSVPAIEAFKWLPPRAKGSPLKGSPKGSPVKGSTGTGLAGETSAGEGTIGQGTGKSVRDRVKELDLAIDSAGAMKFDNPTFTGLRRKRSFFGIGRWRERF
jgi:hypothetical protein